MFRFTIYVVHLAKLKRQQSENNDKDHDIITVIGSHRCQDKTVHSGYGPNFSYEDFAFFLFFSFFEHHAITSVDILSQMFRAEGH